MTFFFFLSLAEDWITGHDGNDGIVGDGSAAADRAGIAAEQEPFQFHRRDAGGVCQRRQPRRHRRFQTVAQQQLVRHVDAAATAAHSAPRLPRTVPLIAA